MASLNVEARMARLEARRLRDEARGLRLTARSMLLGSRERLERVQVEADRARATRCEPLPSPWTELYWTRSYDTLEHALIPLPPPPSDR